MRGRPLTPKRVRHSPKAVQWGQRLTGDGKERRNSRRTTILNKVGEPRDKQNHFEPRSLCLNERIAVNRKSIVASILAKASKYRRLTRMVGDNETIKRILELTDELKERALALATPDEEHIRVRAREIWDENGRPSGRDEEFWYQAERELHEAEELAKHAVEDA
jgi:hypothetical protein